MDLWLVVLLLLEPQVQGELRVSGDIHDRTLTWDGALWHRTAHEKGFILSGPVPTDCTVIPSTKLLSTGCGKHTVGRWRQHPEVYVVCALPLGYVLWENHIWTQQLYEQPRACDAVNCPVA
jgi:hypothetical protein